MIIPLDYREPNQQVNITDKREWVIVLVLQLVLDLVQQLETWDQHAVLVKVVLVQAVHRNVHQQRSRLALHDVAIQTDVQETIRDIDRIVTDHQTIVGMECSVVVKDAPGVR